ncbi:glycosyl transferase [Candidatus Roizmanbacteria bacterium CG_4_10_14_0_2_um_filter_36_35]|uniref:Glycosyl transferase n=4 Tax=Candidatus Roizmaniibacteriota TaxID=1752723 RepID=A0A2M7BWQ9_9BACT|nr:MAG: glycosyl transferase [Candidatus Roizmanbacteria bacterium CG11_big_fil_rev_8_21_14_0_20_35_14]PIV10981.1 MAG: glycosyl transferase [Candidatus Roizmanbacteria bacterium CG03_land_8_20_14_0_80_35_26]PIZ68204.1 MAG: glycosyl transferase [Candidatus Roizmanbacteria bacterium CG_4_10_14_0_2_um_filter_36_35]PJC31006.1 MAG: glycosyl transferase [Candidatus Roizmanbacteria bacterium CG_4_9_14_0_2_um_filter_36_12]
MKYKKISIIIPVFNEEKYIKKIVSKVIKANTLNLLKEIIIVNDGSTDKTKNIINKINRNKKNVILINQEKNFGKGATLKLGFLKSTGDIVLIQDSDLEYDPTNYPLLIKPFIENNADVVFGSRFISNQPHRVLFYWHYLANIFLTMLSNIFTNLNLTDMETGFKVFRGDILRKLTPCLRSKRFGFEPEITAKISKIKDIKIYEVGISYFGRTYQEGKKIYWFDGLKAVWEIIRFNLFPDL